MKRFFYFQTISLQKKISFTLCVVLLFLSGCGLKKTLPKIDSELSCYSVTVADGPEDFVLDNLSFGKRLIISSHDRRNPTSSGGIFIFDLISEASKEMIRNGEPEKIKAFRPHGIDIRHDETGSYLYVIIHDPQNLSKRDENAIAVYRILENSLNFITLLENKKHLWSPNDLSVMQSGEIYVTNDCRTKFDLYFKRHVSEVVRYQPEQQEWSIVVSGLGYANGIMAQPDKVYISTTFENQLFIYKRNVDGTLTRSDVIGPIKGLDNLMPHGDKIITTAHFDDLAFLRHMGSKDVISPSVVFVIDPAKKTYEPIYVDSGSGISAASTAFIYDKKLYISQVFDSHIRICKLTEND
jgi:hypothetical protein